MMNNSTPQPNLGTIHTPNNSLPFFIANILGCLLALVSFIFVNWNTSFYVASSSSYPFLNGPGVFHEMVRLYGTLASIWIWITPTAAVVALVLACAGWLLNARLLFLVSIPAGAGLFILLSFLLTGDQWDYYKSNGYVLAVLGLFIILVSGLWARWSPPFDTRKDEASPFALVCCALMGGCLLILSFFLPWLQIQTPFLPALPHNDRPYQGTLMTGLSLANNSFPFLPPAYPRIAPQGYWLLWLIPLVGLLGAGTGWMSLRGRRVSRWSWILLSLIPLSLYLFLLRPAIQGSTEAAASAHGNVTTYGWHLTLLGLVLMFFSGLLWERRKPEEKPSQAQQRRMRIRRILIGGIAGLVAVTYGGYLFWKTNKMYSATLTLTLPTGERYGYGSVAWATDGRRLATTNTNMLWIWDTLAMKQISSVEYPSFVERNTEYAKLAWSPDQRFIATVIGGSAQVYEVAAGKWVSHWSTGNSIDLQQGVAWSADSQYIATTFIGVTTQNNGVGVHDAITGKLVRSFPFPPTEHDGTGQRYSPIMCKTVSWSPDNRWLAGGGLIRNKKMDTYQVFFTIWDASSGTEVFSTSYTPATGIIDNGYQLYITVAWSPDGKQLAVASDTTGVKLWDVPRKKLLRTYIGSGGMFGEGLVWSPDGKYIAASEGNVVRIWDPASDQTLFSYRGHLGINGLSWSPRGNYIASSSLGSIRVWQPDINSF